MQSIAQELGIKGIKSLDRDSLIYRILDGQAMQNSKTGAPAVLKEENRMNRREHRRHRIHSDAPSKVYTATGDKAVKLDNNEPKKVVAEAVAPVPAPAPQVKEAKPVEPVEPAVAQPAENNAPNKKTASKKRTRKPKAVAEAAAPVVGANVAVEVVEEKVETPVVKEKKEEAPAPKKRGRKPKANKEATQEQPKTEQVEKTVEQSVAEGEAFVAIEDLPSDATELPVELVDKFEKNGKEKKKNDKNQHRHQEKRNEQPQQVE